MTTPLSDFDGVDLENDIKEKLNDLGSRLNQTLENNRLLGGLLARRLDCREGLSFVVEHPKGGRYLCPHFLNILDEEIKRDYGHRGDEMFLRGPSAEIQIYASGIINRTVDKELFWIYDNLDIPVEVLLSNLINGVINGDTPKVRGMNLLSLAKVVRIKPKLVAKHIKTKSLFTQIVDTISQLIDNPITITFEELVCNGFLVTEYESTLHNDLGTNRVNTTC